MKHLKYINELRTSTYRNAATGLRELGHTRRATELDDWSYEVELDRERAHLSKLRELYEPFGEFDVSINGDIITGLLQVVPMVDFFIDFYDEFKNGSSNNLELFFELWFIPNPDEIEGCKDAYDDVMYNGVIPLYNFTYVISKDPGSERAYVDKTHKNDNYNAWDSWPEIPDINFTDRRSAVQFKNILKGIFSGNMFYPYDGSDKDTHDVLNEKIFNRLGLRNDFGLSIQDFITPTQQHSVNSLYTSLYTKLTELKSSTYQSAASKLKQYGHPDRHSKLIDHSYEMAKRNATTNIMEMTISDVTGGGGQYRPKNKKIHYHKNQRALENIFSVTDQFYSKIEFDPISIQETLDYLEDGDYDEFEYKFFIYALPNSRDVYEEMREHYADSFGPWYPVGLASFIIGPDWDGLGEDDWKIDYFNISGLSESLPDLEFNRRIARYVKNEILKFFSEDHPEYETVREKTEALGLSTETFKNYLQGTSLNNFYKD